MNGNEFADAITKILDDQNMDPQATRRLLIALTLDTRTEIAACSIANTKHHDMLEQLIKTQNETLLELTGMIQRHDDYIQTHPSLVYLLRFRTKETVATVLAIVIILSAWYVSGIRQPILEWLGLPVF